MGIYEDNNNFNEDKQRNYSDKCVVQRQTMQQLDKQQWLKLSEESLPRCGWD